VRVVPPDEHWRSTFTLLFPEEEFLLRRSVTGTVALTAGLIVMGAAAAGFITQVCEVGTVKLTVAFPTDVVFGVRESFHAGVDVPSYR